MKNFVIALAYFALTGAASASPAYIEQSPFAQGATPLTINAVDLSSLSSEVDAMLAPLTNGQLPAASVVQSGIGHRADITQIGTDNFGLIVQQGARNTATLFQAGSRNMGHIHQVGLDNMASVRQTGSNHRAMVSQRGTGNVAIIRQY